MKKFLIATAALSILVPSLAAAQERGEGRDRGNWAGRGGDRGERGGGDRGGGDRGGGWRGRGGGGEQAAPAQGGGDGGGRFRGRGVIAEQPRQIQPRAEPQAERREGAGQRFDGGQRFGGGERRFDGGAQRFEGRGGERNGAFAGRGVLRDEGERRFDNRRFDNNRGYDQGRRFDNRGGYAQRGGGRFFYRGNSFSRYRASPYRWPRAGYSSYRWRAGALLPSTFLLREYFIDDYYDLGFGPPPPGAEWIRVGDDALLVDIYTGEILEVVPGVFYW